LDGEERTLCIKVSATDKELSEKVYCEVIEAFCAATERSRTPADQSGTRTFRSELHTVTGLAHGKLVLDKGEIILRGGLHLDQGLAVTSHAAQGKTVDQVIVSVPIESFSQANEAQFYVSMSRAREAMHLFTDSKLALREAVARPSGRLSPLELMTDPSAIERLQSASRYLRGRTPAQPHQQIIHEAPNQSHER
jgi:hypothetical protein